MFSFLPLGQRVIDEMKRVIDHHMDEVGAQKMQMPILQNLGRWDQTGRREKMGKELYTLKDRKGQDYCLSPTNEEVITSLVKELAVPADYPMILYQTSSKFRDEKRIFSSVLRSKEFLMMDAYSFDKSIGEASASFDRMDQCFKDIFKDLEIPVESLDADTGVMGGSKSREYQCLCGIGQDTVVKCSNCNYTSLYPLSTSVSSSIPYFESESFRRLKQDLEVLTSKEDFAAILDQHGEIMELMDVYSLPSLHKQLLIPRGRDANVKDLTSDDVEKVSQIDHSMDVSINGENDVQLLVDTSLSELFPTQLASLYHVLSLLMHQSLD